MEILVQKNLVKTAREEGRVIDIVSKISALRLRPGLYHAWLSCPF